MAATLHLIFTFSHCHVSLASLFEAACVSNDTHFSSSVVEFARRRKKCMGRAGWMTKQCWNQATLQLWQRGVLIPSGHSGCPQSIDTHCTHTHTLHTVSQPFTDKHLHSKTHVYAVTTRYFHTLTYSCVMVSPLFICSLFVVESPQSGWVRVCVCVWQLHNIDGLSLHLKALKTAV